MNKKLLVGMTLPVSLISSTLWVNAQQNTEQKLNVLFLVMDDLRPELNCYGHTDMITPNIDKLAANGILFSNAYCNIPVSGASRASLFTGLRPTMTRFYDVESKIDEDAPGIPTLPLYLKQNGYQTMSNSKIIHAKTDAKNSWTSIWYPNVNSKTWRNYLGTENAENDGTKHGTTAYECLDVADNAYIDGMTADKTIEQLRGFAKSGQPFFMATGILKPHLPFNAPKKYWDLYNFDDIQLPDDYSLNRSTFPSKAFHTWGELRFYKNIPDTGKIQSDIEARKLIHGYKACVSYADAQVGRILEELKNLGLDKNTVVVLVGDHGWSLGDHGDWCKHSNFTKVNNTVLLLSGPGLPKNKIENKMVELVDIYPTVCSMLNLPVPPHTEGNDMVKLMKKGDSKWDNDAVIKWHDGLTYMTQQYRYTEWIDKKDNVVARMLFDIKADKNEDVNLAEKPEYQKLMKKFSKELRKKRGKDFLK